MIADVLFVLCALFAIGGAVMAVSVRNLLHAALLLGVSLLGVAGLYLFLDDPWLACVQVIVYVGGILVLILFATLFSSDVTGLVVRRKPAMMVLGVVVAALGIVAALRLVFDVDVVRCARNVVGSSPAAAKGGSMDAVGELLLGEWFVPFTVAGLLLTVALVVAVAIVQRYRRPPVEVDDA